MAERLTYHWRHGWIPLSHAAALSKAHGNRKAADKLVPGAGKHGLNRHGAQTEISRGDLRRSHTVDAHHASGGKVALHDQRSGETVHVHEGHAASFHDQGHTVTGVSGGLLHTRSDYGTDHVYNPQTGRAADAPKKSTVVEASRETRLRWNSHTDAELKQQHKYALAHNQPEFAANARAVLEHRGHVYNPATKKFSKESVPSGAHHAKAQAETEKAARLRAAAAAKRAEAESGANGVGFGDRAAGRLGPTGLRQFNRNTDSSLRRYTAATNTAENLDHKAALAEGRARSATQKAQDAARGAAGTFGPHNIKPGDIVKRRGETHIVQRANTKTVSVPHYEPRLADAGYTDTFSYSQITEHRSIDSASTDALQKLLVSKRSSSAVKSRVRQILAKRGIAA